MEVKSMPEHSALGIQQCCDHKSDSGSVVKMTLMVLRPLHFFQHFSLTS